MKIQEILLVEAFHQPGSMPSMLSVIADERLAIEHRQSMCHEQGRTLWKISVEIDEQANPDFGSTADVARGHVAGATSWSRGTFPDPLNLETQRAVTAAVRAVAIQSISTTIV